ncbi:glycosyltransferase family 4 protein [Gramella lutea]|uniref:Glycosyltransferase family 4 protein n=1 Tax=Christiangramia lutea TaxID=1607951 RepID=A0A9X2A8Z5_9FLAO|nr:glycosyltransferase family 4 protein [Christiangramia lutea]MCH4821561.1 glycosyltransferase family 4 protein [Christiangramia lutea]
MSRILYIGNKLEKHGFSPTSIDTLSPALESEGFKLKAVSSIKNKPRRLLDMLWNILKNYSSRDIVLIDTYSTSNFWYAVLSGLLCRRLSIPYIFILHGGNLKFRLEKASKSILKIFQNAQACVVPSHFLMNHLEVLNLQNLQHIPNTIELSKYDFKLRNSVSPKLFWVRSFAEIYNPILAVEVLEGLLKNYPEAELYMVGPEKDRSFREVKELVEKKNLPVVFTGKLDKEDWIRLSKDYDIFINTTNIDNTPVSVMEAMALGLPIVSTNVGGIPFLIDDGENGLLVEPKNSEAMRIAIERLLGNAKLAEGLSRNGRKSVEKFDWDKVKAEWIELLG